MKNGSAAAAAAPEPVPTTIDPVAVDRTVPITAVADIPVPPAAYRPYDAKAGQALVKVDFDHRAEGEDGLQECVKLGEQIFADLGSNAPHPARAAALADRIQSIDAARNATNHLLAYLNQVDLIVMNDTFDLLDAIKKLYDANVTLNPTIAARYVAVRKFIAARGKNISEGIATAKALEEAKKGPPTGK